MSNWRRWLIDIPAHITDVAATWYRLWLTVVLVVVGPGLMLMVLAVLTLWFGLGIRWGW